MIPLRPATMPSRRTRVAASNALAINSGTAAGLPRSAPATPASKIDKQVQATSEQLANTKSWRSCCTHRTRTRSPSNCQLSNEWFVAMGTHSIGWLRP